MAAAPRAPRVGVLGGTFDPVHLGHLIVAAELRHRLVLDRVIVAPAGRPPHKSAREVSDDAHRLAMLRLALAERPAFEVSAADMERDGPSYTADLLALLREELAPERFFFLMGNDSLRDLPTWHQPARIAELAELGVAARPGVLIDLEAIERAVPAVRGRVHLVPTPLIEIASRDIRRRVQQGEPITFQVPLAVERYIREHGLYRS